MIGTGRSVIVSVRFDPKTVMQLRKIAKRMNMRYTALIRLAVARFLAIEED